MMVMVEGKMLGNNLEYLREDYSKSEYFNSRFGSGTKVFQINHASELTSMLLEKLESLLNIPCSLEELGSVHNHLDKKLKIYDDQFKINKISTYLYEMPEAFKKRYHQLLKTDVRDLIGEDFYFQDNPTLRMQTPHISSKSLFPLYHSDIQLGHPPYEINLWMPLNPPSKTEGYGFSISPLEDSLEIFRRYDLDTAKISGDQKKITEYLNPISDLLNFDYGQAILFDPRRFHSSQPLENHTRVSMDVRIVPVKEFHKFGHSYQGSGRKRVQFRPGDAYNLKSIDNI